MYNTSTAASRSDCIIVQGESDVGVGAWAEDDETGKVSCLEDAEDVVCIYKEDHSVWDLHRFNVRQPRRGAMKTKGT